MLTIGMVFWILMIIWLVFEGLARYRSGASPAWPAAGDLFVFILFLLLGIQVFGWPIRG
jgi:hypothetical protein